MTLNIETCTETADALLTWYPGQSAYQPVYLELDPSRERVSICEDGELGGVPADVWEGRRYRFRVPLMHGRTANETMRDPELNALVKTLFEAHEEENDDAIISASADIERFCEGLEGDVSVEWARDWFRDSQADFRAEIEAGRVTSEDDLADFMRANTGADSSDIVILEIARAASYFYERLTEKN